MLKSESRNMRGTMQQSKKQRMACKSGLLLLLKAKIRKCSMLRMAGASCNSDLP
jgi:hypothetical protein